MCILTPVEAAGQLGDNLLAHLDQRKHSLSPFLNDSYQQRQQGQLKIISNYVTNLQSIMIYITSKQNINNKIILYELTTARAVLTG